MDQFMEFGSEVLEQTEVSGLEGVDVLMNEYQSEIDTAVKEGNPERENYYKSKLERLQEQMYGTHQGAVSETSDGRPARGSELSFGSREGYSDGHSESYWAEKAGKELAEHGKTASYDLYMKRLGEAKAERIKSRGR